MLHAIFQAENRGEKVKYQLPNMASRNLTQVTMSCVSGG